MATAPNNRWLVGTFLGFASAIGLVLWLVRPTFDLAYFLPVPTTSQERVLVERLGQGAGAKLVFVEISTADGVDATALSTELKDRLSRSPLLLRVENGQYAISIDHIPQSIWKWRYLLTDVDWSETGIRRALSERLGDLALIGGPDLAQLVAADPLWAAPRVLESLQMGGPDFHPRWSEGSRRAFLVAETRAPPFDIKAQEAVIELIQSAWYEVSGTHHGLELFGVGVYGAKVQSIVQSEAALLGLLATAVVLVIVTFAYRSMRLTALSVIPLASAILGGLLASSLVFGRIHGITIAFGATLVGVVDDYPMHLFSHARHMSPRTTVRVLWRTLLVSAGTAIIAYASLVASGSRGLAQLGVFSLAGIVCAMAVTCWVLPNLMEGESSSPEHDNTPQIFELSGRIWLPLLAFSAAAISIAGGIHWNDSLGDMTPLPRSVLAKDHAMRERFGAPDVRYLISVTGSTSESVLTRTEALQVDLADARRKGLIAAWSTVTALLPSAEVQEQRRAAIPPPEILKKRLLASSAGLPFRHDAFSPFLSDAAYARETSPIAAQDLIDSFTSEYVSGHLTSQANEWRSVVFLAGLSSPEGMSAWLKARNLGAELVDLKSASDSLVRGYRVHLMSIVAVAMMLIATLVFWHTGSFYRFCWTAGTVFASVLFTLATINWMHDGVSLFHMVSLVLVAGLGVDYCLFYSRQDVSRTEFMDTRHAVTACASSTAGAFAILGASSIPLLSTIGTTVAIGTITLLLAARVGCRAS